MGEPAMLDGLFTVEEYLRLEMESPVKHEYVAGRVFAMVGVSKRHNRINGNIFTKLDTAAAGTPCRVYFAEVKVRTPDDIFYYPDVMVACGPEGSDSYVEDRPCLLVEITSPTTEMVDRREKLFVYQKIQPLRAYLIVDQEQRRVDRFWRDADDTWHHSLHSDAAADPIPIPCPETQLTLDEIYARLE